MISCKSRSYTVIENSDGVTLFHEGKAILKIADERIKDEVIIYQVDENGSVLK